MSHIFHSAFLRSVPSVKKIVYSTCSIHAIENEGVVKHVLASEECQLGNFRLAPRNEVLPSWPRRGLAEEFDSLGIFSFSLSKAKKYNHTFQTMLALSYDAYQAKMLQTASSFLVLLRRIRRRQLGRGSLSMGTLYYLTIQKSAESRHLHFNNIMYCSKLYTKKIGLTLLSRFAHG